jgi:hypothetical protein
MRYWTNAIEAGCWSSSRRRIFNHCWPLTLAIDGTWSYPFLRSDKPRIYHPEIIPASRTQSHGSRCRVGQAAKRQRLKSALPPACLPFRSQTRGQGLLRDRPFLCRSTSNIAIEKQFPSLGTLVPLPDDSPRGEHGISLMGSRFRLFTRAVFGSAHPIWSIPRRSGTSGRIMEARHLLRRLRPGAVVAGC